MTRITRMLLPILLLAALPVDAAVFRVTKTADTLDGVCGPDCSLREAVQASNLTPEQDVILLGPGVYTLTRPAPFEDHNLSGDLDVRGVLAIFGEGPDRTVLDGNGTDRVLEVHDPGSLDLHRVTVRNGALIRPSTIPFFFEAGGGVQGNHRRLTVVESVITANRTDAYGGGLAGSDLVVRDTTVSGNEAVLGGGGIVAWAWLRAENVTVSGNRAGNEGGGGLLMAPHDQEIAHSTVTGNVTTGWGGGIGSMGIACPSSSSEFCEPRFTLRRSIVAGNSDGHGMPDCAGLEEIGEGFNVFGVADGCGPGIQDLAGTLAAPLDPKLSPLGDHGGPTPTHLPLPGSPAIDLGTGCAGKDQRGAPRPAALCDSGSVEVSAACVSTDTDLCLQDGRFRVTASWKTSGDEGPAKVFPITADTGSFWFFAPDNLEITVKVLNGCSLNDRFWVFLSGLTNVEVEVRVEDTRTGETWTHIHPAGAPLQPRLDTAAFACVNQ